MHTAKAHGRLMYAGMAIVVAAGLMLWWPAHRDIGMLQQRIDQTQQSLLGAKGQVQDLTNLAMQVQAIRDEIAATSKSIPQQDELADLLRNLSMQMSVLGVTEPSMTSQTVIPGDGYQTLPLDISFSSGSQSAFAFVNRMESMARLAQPTRLRLELAESGQVDVSLRLNTYFYESEPSR